MRCGGGLVNEMFNYVTANVLFHIGFVYISYEKGSIRYL